MKIGSFDNKAVNALATERRSGTGSAARTASAGSAPSTQVALSETAAKLSAGGSDGVFDTAKVERISNAIREGKFKVNPEAIADKLISNAQELLGNVRRS